MTLQAENSQELRQYLLGDLTGEAQRRVEERLLTEPDFLEELLVGEEELMDDYVGGELSADERLKFERHFLSTPERRRQVEAFSRLDAIMGVGSSAPAMRAADVVLAAASRVAGLR